MNTKPVTLPRPLVNQLLHLAQQAPDEEVCGLIGGREQHFEHCYPVANVAGDRAHLFEMDARGLVAAMRVMRDRGEELLAIYHSHPTSPAEPSPIDLRQHEYPGVLYLIVSLDTKGVLDLRGFRLDGGRVQRVPIAI